MLAVSEKYSLIVSLSLWLGFCYYSSELSKFSLVQTFVFASVNFTFMTVVLLSFSLKIIIFTLHSLYHVSLSLSYAFTSVIFTLFLHSQVSLLTFSTLVCVTPSHITRGISNTFFYIRGSYIS